MDTKEIDRQATRAGEVKAERRDRYSETPNSRCERENLKVFFVGDMKGRLLRPASSSPLCFSCSRVRPYVRDCLIFCGNRRPQSQD